MLNNDRNLFSTYIYLFINPMTCIFYFDIARNLVYVIRAVPIACVVKEVGCQLEAGSMKGARPVNFAE